MSETEQKERPEVEPMSEADLQRMLEDARSGMAERDRQLAEERARVAQISRERDEIAGQAGNAAEQRYAALMREAEAGLSAASADMDRLEEAYATAMETGNHREAARAQRQLAETSTKLAEARNQKRYLEGNKSQLTAPPEVRQRDKYDGVASDLRPSEREWLDRRPRFLSDESYRKRVYNAAEIAGAEGLSRGSQDYLSRMEEILRERDGDDAPQQRFDRRPSADVAPTRRQSPGGEHHGSREINLTSDERDAADMIYGNQGDSLYVADPAERYMKYAKNKKLSNAPRAW